MSATPIAASVRYINPEVTITLFVPAIADKEAPTRVELDAGTDLSGEVAELTGWTVTSAMVGTPDLSSKFTSQISGRTSAEDSAINMYADRTGADVRTLLPRGTTGFVVIMDGGDVATQPMDVFPVTVSSVGKPRSVEGTAGSTINVAFAITDEPAENVAIPA